MCPRRKAVSLFAPAAALSAHKGGDRSHLDTGGIVSFIWTGLFMRPLLYNLDPWELGRQR